MEGERYFCFVNDVRLALRGTIRKKTRLERVRVLYEQLAPAERVVVRFHNWNDCSREGDLIREVILVWPGCL